MIAFLKKKLTRFIQNPFHVFIFCVVFLIFNLLIDSTLFQILRMGRDLKVIQNRIQYMEEKNETIQSKIKIFSDPQVIKKELRDRLDLSNEGDLIFTFPEDI